MSDVSVDQAGLVFVRDLRHPPEKVWAALTDPARLDQWAPFSAARDLSTTGETVLTMVDGPDRTDIPAVVHRAEAPELLEYTWGGDLLRWELAPTPEGTRLTLRHLRTTDLDKIAAGWHICVGVLIRLLDGDPVGVIRGRDAMAHGWEDLRAGYAEKFGLPA